MDGIIAALEPRTVHKITLRHGTAGVITCYTTVLVITLERGCGLIGWFVKVVSTLFLHFNTPCVQHTPTYRLQGYSFTAVGPKIKSLFYNAY